MRKNACRVARYALTALILVSMLVSCSPGTPPADEAPYEVSVARLCDSMQLTDGMARDVLAVLEDLGYEGEVLFAYPVTDADEKEYYHIWMGEDTADIYISPLGAVTSVRKSGILIYDATADSADVPPPSQTEEPSEIRVPLRLVSATETVAQGETARVELTAEAGVEYRIEVYYKSGVSSAKGLEPRLAAPNGNLVWEWKVNSRVAPGDYRIRVLRVADETDAVELPFSVVAAP